MFVVDVATLLPDLRTIAKKDGSIGIVNRWQSFNENYIDCKGTTFHKSINTMYNKVLMESIAKEHNVSSKAVHKIWKYALAKEYTRGLLQVYLTCKDLVELYTTVCSL